MAASAHSAVDSLAASAGGRGFSRLRTFKQFAQTRCVTLECCDETCAQDVLSCHSPPQTCRRCRPNRQRYCRRRARQ
jgi:hypothetical protein